MRLGEREVVATPLVRLSYHLGNEVASAKNLVTYLRETRSLVVVATDCNYPVLSKEVARELKARVHHVQPVRVVASLGLGVSRDFLPFFVDLPRPLQVGREPLLIVVGVHEVVASVVRGIDINQLDLGVVMLLQKFEDFEVVALNEDVLCCVPLPRVRLVGPQRGGRWLLRCSECRLLAGPEQAKTFAITPGVVSKEFPELGNVDLAVSDRLGDEFLELLG